MNVLQSLINFEEHPSITNETFNTKIECYNIFFDNTPQNIRKEIKNAIKTNNKDYVIYLIKLGYNDYNGGLYEASRMGNLELVKFFIDNGANDYSGGLCCASSSGHIEVVKFFTGKGILNYMPALIHAKCMDRRIVVEYLNKLINK